MHIIEIEALPNGAHRNQQGGWSCPEGWAVIPEWLPLPVSFPFVTLEIHGGTVTSMAPVPVPGPAVPPECPDRLDTLEAQVTYTAMMTDTLI